MSLNSKPTRADRSGAVPRGPILAVALGTALVLVTYVTPVVSVAATSADLGSGDGSRAWILSSMSLGLAAGLLAAGVVGDASGRRRTVEGGLLALAVGALACAVAPAASLVVAGRVLQGLGGAAVLACGLSLLAAHTAPGPARVRATGIWGASVGLGIALGCLLSAVLDPVGTGWRESYGVVAVLAVLLLVPTHAVTESAAEHPRRIDLPGLILLAGGLTALVAALTAARDGLGTTPVLLTALAVVLLAGFVVVERRAAMPLVDLGLLRSPGFATATLGSLTLGAGMIGMASFVPTFVQAGLGLGVWAAVLPTTAWAAASVATSLLLPRLPRPIGGAGDIAVVMGVVAVGQLAALGVGRGDGVLRLTVALALAGVGTGVLNAVLGRESVASVPPDRSAMGSGANNTARYLGAAVGITLFVTIATHAGDDVVDGWTVAVVVTAALTLLGAAAIAWVGRRVPVTDVPRPTP